MMTTLYHSLDLQNNSDSDDDFMVDSIMPENKNDDNIHRLNGSGNSVKCRSMTNDNSFPRLMKCISKPSREPCKLSTKRNIPNIYLYHSKIVKLKSDQDLIDCSNKFSQFNYTLYDTRSIRDQLECRSVIDICESSSNIPSPFAISDHTHSVASSSNDTLNNDPIITSVVLNEDKRFSDLKPSFDKSSYSMSIDDNLLRPIRQKPIIHKPISGSNNAVFSNKNQSIQDYCYGTATKIKRARSIGFDDLVPLREREYRPKVLYESVRLSPTSLSMPKHSKCSSASSSTKPLHSSLPSTASSSLSLHSRSTGHNKRKHLLQFIIDLLKEGHSCVMWTNERDKEFVISQPDKLAKLWAAYKNNSRMTFDSLARSLRLYYAPKKLERISGKKNQYRILNVSNEI